MMQWFLVFGLVALVCGAVWTDDARRLRFAAAALVQSSERAESSQSRLALLEEAHGKLVEIQERYPSEPARLLIYLGGERTTLSPNSLHKITDALRLAELEVGKLRAVLGRALAPTDVDENGWRRDNNIDYYPRLDSPTIKIGDKGYVTIVPPLYFTHTLKYREPHRAPLRLTPG